MTLRPNVVDLYVLRGRNETLQVLILRRSVGGRCPGSWEGVHGNIEPGETPVMAVRREMAEETGLAGLRLYNLSRVELFHKHNSNTLEVAVAFAIFVDGESSPRLGPEHDAFRWLTPDEAMEQVAWPRCMRAIKDAVRLLGNGDAGPVEDVLRVPD
jgi:8-oxo-dGTP pyrophosphatase MutT (NUDIX family)